MTVAKSSGEQRHIEAFPKWQREFRGNTVCRSARDSAENRSLYIVLHLLYLNVGIRLR